MSEEEKKPKRRSFPSFVCVRKTGNRDEMAGFTVRGKFKYGDTVTLKDLEGYYSIIGSDYKSKYTMQQVETKKESSSKGLTKLLNDIYAYEDLLDPEAYPAFGVIKGVVFEEPKIFGEYDTTKMSIQMGEHVLDVYINKSKVDNEKGGNWYEAPKLGDSIIAIGLILLDNAGSDKMNAQCVQVVRPHGEKTLSEDKLDEVDIISVAEDYQKEDVIEEPEIIEDVDENDEEVLQALEETEEDTKKTKTRKKTTKENKPKKTTKPKKEEEKEFKHEKILSYPEAEEMAKKVTNDILKGFDPEIQKDARSIVYTLYQTLQPTKFEDDEFKEGILIKEILTLSNVSEENGNIIFKKLFDEGYIYEPKLGNYKWIEKWRVDL